ncbi:MAG: hypothetical protein ACTSVL_11760 [Promethearchaeota archaeon]
MNYRFQTTETHKYTISTVKSESWVLNRVQQVSVIAVFCEFNPERQECTMYMSIFTVSISGWS